MSPSTPVIFLAFANNLEVPGAYLSLLKREGNNIYRKLWPHREKQAIDLHKVDSSSVSDIFQVFTEMFPDKVCIFHYGGHADGGHLHLESDSGGAELAHSGGLASLLGQQKELKLVFLNGCSTKAQVDLLLKSGVKAVIATSTKINDGLATEFAEQFYSSLSKGANIKRAFYEARALGETKFNITKDLDVEVVAYHRSLFLDEDDSQPEFPWGLYINENEEGVLDWTLPKKKQELSLLLDPKRIKLVDEVNDHIIFPVFEAIRKVNMTVAVPLDEDDEPDELKIQDLIIENYPLPIGQQIRKLFATTEDMFSFSLPRLKQIIRTYEVVTKFLAYILISQLWDKISREEDATIEDDIRLDLNEIFSLNPENCQTFDFSQIIRSVITVFEKNNWELFISEATNLKELLNGSEDQINSYEFLHNVREHLANGQVLAQDLEQFCREGEFHLAEILKDVAFLSTYRLVTVKDIVLKKDRMSEPAYSIQLGILRGTDSRRIKSKAREYEGYTDSQSVLLIKTVKNINKYQSLSPFIIDENAFTGHPSFKIFFYHYTQDGKYFYDFLDSQGEQLEISQDQYPHIQSQFERFRSDMP